jgi:hypothetical protein
MKRTPLLRKTRLSPLSKKRQGKMSQYRKLRINYLTEMRVCWVCVGAKATDVHHKNGRHNERLNAVEHWLPVCRKCHDWIHQNPQKARDKGYLI